MRILVTGGGGFVGSNICLSLRNKYPQYTITAFDNLKRRGSELNLKEFKEKDIQFIHGDIRNLEDFSQIDSFDVMIEASAEPSVLAGLNSDPTYVINNNLFGSINCLNACIKNDAKLVFLSTSRVYPIERIESANFIEEETRFTFDKIQQQNGISEKGISEELSLDGARSFYGTTKLSTELFIKEYVEYYNLKASIIRYGVIAGPRQMGKTDQGVVTLWVAKHYWKQKLSYIGYGGLGKQVRDILHIDDLFDLVDKQIHEMEKFNNTVFNAGGGVLGSVSLLEMTKLCQQITGNTINIDSEIVNRPADLRIYITDNSKLESHLLWKPKHNAESTLLEIFKWINGNEKLLKPLLM